MATKVTIQNGQFQDAAGNPITGTLNLQLSQDAVVTGTGTVAPVSISIVVTAGNAVATPVWGVDNLTPSGLVYVARLFDASGALVWGPENWSIAGAGPIELNTLTPASSSVSYPGAVILSPSADQTITANNLLPASGNTSQSLGSSTAPWNAVINSLKAKNFENVLIATEFAGADIGAQINAAYAALPSSGGVIYIPAQASGAVYSFSTPIVLNTANKYVRLEGLGSNGGTNASGISGTVLNYTPTSGTAITLDYVTPSNLALSAAHGLRNITIVNNGNTGTGTYTGTAVAIDCGSTNSGPAGGQMENLSVIGFPIGFQDSNAKAVQINFINPQFISNGTAFKIGNLTGIWLFGGQVAGNTTGIAPTASNVQPEIMIYGTQFFSNTSKAIDFSSLSGAYARVECYGVHFENTNAPNSHLIDGLIDLYVSGGIFEDDVSSVTRDYFINASGRVLHIEGTRFLCGSGSTVTNIVNANSPVRGIMRGVITTGTFSGYVTGANAGKITVEMLSGPSTTAATDWVFESRINAQAGGLTFGNSTMLAYDEGTWSPVATNLANTGGAPTITGVYVRIGKHVTYSIKIVPVTNTSSTANSTNITLPFTPMQEGAGTCVAASNSVASFGVGLIAVSALCYPPSWTNVTGTVYVTGTYRTT